MRRRTVVLLQPKIGDMDGFRDKPTPPMALLHASTLLAEEFDVILVDQRLGPDWERALADALATRPVALGVTTLTGPMVGQALRMVRAARRQGDVPVVWGGTHVSMLPAQAAACDGVDLVVTGEGEQAFLAVARELARGGDPATVPGTWRRKDGEVRSTPRGGPLDFAALPLAPYGLVDMERYMYTYGGRRTLDYLSSRGCPYSCAYCYNTVFHRRRWSAKPADVVAVELAALRKRYDFEALYFLDDNFFIDWKRAWEILAALKTAGLKFELQGVDIQTIARMSDEELSFLSSAGLVKMTIGIETASDRLRERVGKWGDSAVVRQALRRLANRPFLVLTSFIIGFPFESWEETRQTVRLALDLQAAGENFRFPQLYTFTPVPGTPLANELVEGGFRFPETLEEWAGYDWDHCLLFRDDPAKRRRLEAMAFLSKFIDRKMDDYGSRRAFSTLYNLYRPIARARLEHGFLSPLPERKAYDMLRRWV
jgi:radical SAM superfamily enzyme YgiQ (UPF0313 family)